jgi:hypothetical protein
MTLDQVIDEFEREHAELLASTRPVTRYLTVPDLIQSTTAWLNDGAEVPASGDKGLLE